MATVEKSIEVDAPVTETYHQWTRFEEFPAFMEGVREVRQIGATHLHWCAEVGGVEREWDVEITDQIPERRIAWHSISGMLYRGVVEFEPAQGRTHIHMRMEYDPKGIVENTSDAPGFMSRRVEGDLERFKDFLESRGNL